MTAARRPARRWCGALLLVWLLAPEAAAQTASTTTAPPGAFPSREASPGASGTSTWNLRPSSAATATSPPLPGPPGVAGAGTGSEQPDDAGSPTDPLRTPAVQSIPDARAAAAERRRREQREAEDPFAPTGVRAGAFILRPAIEGSIGYDTNPKAERRAKGSMFERLDGELAAESDWSRHSLTTRLRGAFTHYNAFPRDDRPRLEGSADGRVDITEDARLDLNLHGLLDTEQPGDPDTPKNATKPLLTYNYGASAGVTQEFNRFELGLKGLVDRYLFSEVDTGLGKLSQQDRDYTAYEARLRGGYEVSPLLKPYSEFAAVLRRYDTHVDPAGTRQGSTGWRALAGAAFEPTPLMKADLALGYGEQTPEDPSLKPLQGLLVQGSLAWEVTPLTALSAKIATDFNETTLAGSGGALSRTVSADAVHRLRRWLDLKGEIAFTRSDYVGIGRIDDTTTAALALEYRIARELVAHVRIAHERLQSTARGEDYTSNIFEVGLRLQR